MVFQTYALYPHKTVAENMGFALRIARTPQSEIDRQVQKAAEILNITNLMSKKPRELSGGQRQRVAIGRAIVRKPEVFLFDEPLSNLDAELRAKMRTELSRLHGQIDATMIYVTHDQVEAMTMADRIVVLDSGQIKQIGTPQEVFDKPNDLFVARFIGAPAMNILKLANYPELTDALARRFGDRVSDGISLGMRPEDLSVIQDTGSEAKINARFDMTESLGREMLYHGQTAAGEDITAAVRKTETAEPSSVGHVVLSIEHAHLFNAHGNRIPALSEKN
jgi:ABC-type sugar transport system ATPase subunit